MEVWNLKLLQDPQEGGVTAKLRSCWKVLAGGHWRGLHLRKVHGCIQSIILPGPGLTPGRELVGQKRTQETVDAGGQLTTSPRMDSVLRTHHWVWTESCSLG